MKKLSPEISEIQILPVRPKDGLVAFASCLFNNSIVLQSIAIYTRADGSGYRLVYPTKILPNTKQINLFYPINKEIGSQIEKAIITEFENLMKKGEENGGKQIMDADGSEGRGNK